MKTAEEKSKFVDSLIDSIKLDKANVEYILESGRINGSLWADLRRVLYAAMQEYKSQSSTGGKALLQELLEWVQETPPQTRHAVLESKIQSLITREQSSHPLEGAEGGWIRADIELPKDNEDYQIWEQGAIIVTAGHYHDKKYFKDNYDNEDYMEEGWYYSFKYPFDESISHDEPLAVTHYMPLPQSPHK